MNMRIVSLLLVIVVIISCTSCALAYGSGQEINWTGIGCSSSDWRQTSQAIFLVGNDVSVSAANWKLVINSSGSTVSTKQWLVCHVKLIETGAMASSVWVFKEKGVTKTEPYKVAVNLNDDVFFEGKMDDRSPGKASPMSLRGRFYP